MTLKHFYRGFWGFNFAWQESILGINDLNDDYTSVSKNDLFFLLGSSGAKRALVVSFSEVYFQNKAFGMIIGSISW